MPTFSQAINVTPNVIPLNRGIASGAGLRLVKGGLSEVDSKTIKNASEIAGNGSKIASNAGKVLDVVGKVASIFDLIATLGTIARMEMIAANSRARDAELQQKIDELNGELSALNNLLNGKLDDVLRSLGQINLDLDVLPTIAARTSLIPQIDSYVKPIPNIDSRTAQILTYLPQIDSYVKPIPNIDSRTAQILTYLPQIAPAAAAEIVPRMRGEVCKALNSDCWNFPDFGNNNPVDLSGIESDLTEIISKLGIPYGCGSVSVDSVGEGLCLALGGGGGGSPITEEINNLLDQKDRTDEILDAIEAIPEPSLYVPEEWSIKLEGNRPQLIAGMQDKETAGTGSASKWAIVIPRPLPTISEWTWEELIEYFPDYTRGAHCAFLKLTDNSVMRVRASSKSGAKAYLLRMLELVDPRYKPSANPDNPLNPYEIVFTENQKFGNRTVTCRGIAYYETGRKQGEKPTKRWYYPANNP